MKDEDKTKDHLIQELVELRQWVAELEASEMKRKQAEQALRGSEEKYRLVMECLLDIVYEFDLEGKFIYVNKAATHMFGYSKDEILNDIRVQDIITEEDKVPLRKAINNILKGKTIVGERTFIRKDGSKFIGEIHSGPMFKGKDVVGVRGILRDITERKQAEEDIRRLGSAVEQSIDGIAIGDLEPKLLYVNESFARMHGYSPEEMIGMNVVNLYNEEQMGDFKRGLHQIRTHGSWTGEIGHIRKDGTPFPTYMSVTLLKNNNGKRTGILAVARDITERKWTEEELRKSEEKYRILLENSNEGIVVAQDGILKFFNPKVMEITNYSQVELSSKPFAELLHPDDREMAIEHHLKRLKGEEITDLFPFRIIDKYGNIKHLEISGVLISWEGKPATLNFISDISKRKRTEQRLREYEARYSHLLDHMTDGVALTLRGRIIRVNPYMAQMFGFPSVERMEKGLCIWDLAAPGSKKIMRQQSTPRALGLQGKKRFEFRALRKDGSTFPAECNLTLDQSEPHPFVLIIIRDVAERKTSEEQRKLLSERIMTAQERERASIARELHDELGQALTGIKMDMAWIKSHMKGADGAVSDRFEALGNLVDKTLESVREMAASLRPSMLDRLGLRAAIEWYASEFERRTGIECIIESESSDFNIDINRAINVYRIFQEALTNVARHARASRVDVQISQDQGCLTICISDNGRGILPQKLSGPMSLGIAGMRERAELIMGRLDIQSRMGKGTRVIVYLPISP